MAGQENKAGEGHNMSILLEKKLGFGTMRLPLLDAEDPKSIDLESFQQMADLYLERGFCYFDTAYPYHEGLSEEAVRRCVAERYSLNHGKASECLKCGLCERNCPQHLPIRQTLEEFAALYET